MSGPAVQTANSTESPGGADAGNGLPAINRRILIIDDNDAIHQDFRKVLMAEHKSSDSLDALKSAIFGGKVDARPALRHTYEVDSALQGQEALLKVEASLKEGRPYAMTFVDMRMPPGWDGLETIERIWKADPQLEVVICTAYSDYSWDEMQARLGSTAQLLLLRKPFDNMEVAQLASALTEKWSLARQASGRMAEMDAVINQRTRELELANAQLRIQVAERAAAEERSRYESTHDTLTHLPNRKLFLSQLRECALRSRSNPEYKYAVVFLDLDNFKTVNDSLGHVAGDDLLAQVARQLVESVNESNTLSGCKGTVARLGGDEFVVLLDGIREATEAARVAERIGRQLARPFLVSGHELFVTPSIGIALSDVERPEAEDVLRDADTAMYHAKASGKARHALFDREMHQTVRRRLLLENDLRHALERGEFHLVYQPILSLETARVHGFEALLRWRHPKHGLIAPSDFIPIAEEIGTILPLGRWVLREACAKLQEWNGNRDPADRLSMSVNVSKRQLLEVAFLDDVKDALHAGRLDADRLHLEVTESIINRDAREVVEGLQALRGLGVELHMDDFGTGLSSLSTLHEFPLDVLKVDRAFVQTMGAQRKYTAVVHAIINLAHNLDMKVTAEGVETTDQLAQILSLNCDFGQGFLFAKPMPATEAGGILDHVFTMEHPVD